MARLMEMYKTQVVSEVMEKFGYTNRLAVPRLEKIVVNMGVGRATENRKRLDDALRDLTTIAGQRPIVTKARQSVAGFKVRKGNDIGCKVTIRGRRMYEFLDRLISLAVPRIRDFRGFPPTSFDGRGNYTIGIGEQGVFPEVDLDKVEFVQGMDITLTITGGSDEASREVLQMLGFPFRPDEGRSRQRQRA